MDSPTASTTRIIPLHDGAEMHLDVHGNGDPLLWLHGMLGHGADWRHVFGEPPPGYQVIAPDLRGHARSNGGRDVFSFREVADDITRMLDALSLARVRVIGVSGGGIAALHLATSSPDRLSHMLVVSAPAAFPPGARAIQRIFSIKSVMEDAERERLRTLHARPDQLEALASQIRAMATQDDPNFSAADLARVTAKTRVVYGERDMLYPVEVGRALADAIPGAELDVVPRAGHVPIFGQHAARFAARVLEFFDRN
jgi:pimeloyl-ACP methyl ester carboxylesterase